MLGFSDVTESFEEKRTVREEQRVKPSVSSAIGRAAAAIGMDESSFIISAAYEKAKEIERAQFATLIDPELFDAFAAAVASPGQKIPGLAQKAKASEGLLEDG